MHVPDGFLPLEVGLTGQGLTAGLLWFSLDRIRRLPQPTAGIPKTALLTAAFFAVSAIALPIPPTSIHLLLNGVMGIILGIYVFPAVWVGLLLQVLMFQHGGLLSLGVNSLIYGVPALLMALLFHLRRWLPERPWVTVLSGLCGSGGVMLSVGLFYGFTLMVTPDYWDEVLVRDELWRLVVWAHGPVALMEGVFTILLVQFLQRVKPELIPTVR
ncbi:MAG: cobalt transporter CbiM [Oscillatoriales cyanobacterium SM2_2_1]|nr:cobalt transporter CbiM [Oscillatoriales cyanobacterium SM2_2_1]